MSGQIDEIYSFVYRGHLSVDALEQSGATVLAATEEDDIDSLLATESLDDRFVAQAKKSAQIYVVIAAFENSVRELVSTTLKENIGDDWWVTCVSEKIRNQAEARIAEEEKTKWHTPRGNDAINFTMLPNLLNIIRQNHTHFEALIHDIDWAANIFDIIERSRNVIMHSGSLSRRDMARLGTFIRDWSSQVYS
jgi:Swt1-like HEPN